MDLYDLKQKLNEDLEDLIGRWFVNSESKRILRACRVKVNTDEPWLKSLLEEVNKTFKESTSGETQAVTSKEREAALAKMKKDAPTVFDEALAVVGELEMVNYKIDPFTIITIILAIIKLWQSCKLNAAQATKRANNPRFLDKRTLRRVVAEHQPYPEPGEDADDTYVCSALLDRGVIMTEARMKLLYKEVKKFQTS